MTAAPVPPPHTAQGEVCLPCMAVVPQLALPQCFTSVTLHALRGQGLGAPRVRGPGTG